MAKKASPAARAGRQHAAAPPHLIVKFRPEASVFYIDADGRMPQIVAVCTLPPAGSNASALQPGSAKAGLPAKPVYGPELPPTYRWSVTLTLNPAGVPHAVGRTTSHPPMVEARGGPQFRIPFVAIRGGTLEVQVSTTVEGRLLSGKAVAQLLGTDPTLAGLRGIGIPDILIQLMTVETTTRSQFLRSGSKRGYPLFSQDGLGGVGLGQLTRPRPSDDQVWSWIANARGALDLFRLKEQEARQHFTSYMHGEAFRRLVTAYNAARTAVPKVPAAASASHSAKGPPALPAAKKALIITLPEPTDEMVENETIRRYNGEPVIPEYVPLQQNGLLVVTETPDGLHGTAQWHQVSTSERLAAYDASSRNVGQNARDAAGYVEKVRAVVLQ